MDLQDKLQDHGRKPIPIFEDPTGRRRVLTVAVTLFAVLAVLLWWGELAIRIHQLGPPGGSQWASAKAGPDSDVRPAPAVSVVLADATDPCEPRRTEDMPTERQIVAYLPAADATAASALAARCNDIDLVLVEAFSLSDLSGSVALLTAGGREIEELSQRGGFDVLPVLGIAARLTTAEAAGLLGSADTLSRLRLTVGLLQEGAFGDGLCLDLSRHSDLPPGLVAGALAALRTEGRRLCLIAPADAPFWLDGRVVEAVDLAVLQGFRTPVNPAQPPAPFHWFEETIPAARAGIPASKLVVALGVGGVAWRSGQAGMRRLSYADTMLSLRHDGASFVFVPEAGAARIRFLDAARRLNDIWLLDAASFETQLRAIGGALAVAVWPLGHEDPAVWSLLSGTGSVDDPVDLGHVLRVEGTGPLVSHVVPAVLGRRVVERDPETGRITALSYDPAPAPARMLRTGSGTDTTLVLTFEGLPEDHEGVDAVLLSLAAHGMEATFFVDEPMLLSRGDAAEALTAAGHMIAVHAVGTDPGSAVSALGARFAANGMQLLVAHQTGGRARFVGPPPDGEPIPQDRAEVELFAHLLAEGYVPVMEGLPPPEGPFDPPAVIERVIEEGAGGSSGVLALDLTGLQATQVIGGLPALLSGLAAEGFRFTALREEAGLPRAEAMPPAAGPPLLRDAMAFGVVEFVRTGLGAVLAVLLIVAAARMVVYLALALARRPSPVLDPAFQPAVTVIVPAFNEEKVIGSCLTSLLASTYGPLSIIVVDDGSSDRTSEIVRSVAAAHPRVRLVRQPNGGKWRAANNGLSAVTSPIFVIADADSVFLPDTIAWLVQSFRDNRVGAVAGVVEVGNRENLLTACQTLEYVVSQAIIRRAQEAFGGILVVPGAVGAWRTEAVRKAGLFSGDTITEDADLTIAVHRAGYRVRFQEQARSVTEVPTTVDAFLRQRLRWTFGMLQCSSKHRGAVLEGRAVGSVSIIDGIWLSLAFGVLSPIVDLVLLVLVSKGLLRLASDGTAALSDFPIGLLVGYGVLTALDVLYALLAFRFERRFDWKLLALVPLVRFGYRQLLYVSMYRALWRAASGQLAHWNKLKRTGHFLSRWNRAHATVQVVRRAQLRLVGEGTLPGLPKAPKSRVASGGALSFEPVPLSQRSGMQPAPPSRARPSA